MDWTYGLYETDHVEASGKLFKGSMCLHPGLKLKHVGLLVGINKGSSGTTSLSLFLPPAFQTFTLFFFFKTILLALLL